MLPDFFVPPGCQPNGGWTPETLGRIVAALRERGREALATLGEAPLLAAWAETVEAFRSPGSPERQALDPTLARLCRLSPEGLAAGMEAVLAGVSGRREGPAAALFARARRAQKPRRTAAAPALAVLAANLPALAVQPLLPALALGRPIFLKSPSAEPLFAPAFLTALVQREPRLAAALAAATWPGGAADLESPVLSGVGTVLAYGGQEAIDDLARRAPGKVVGYGPKASLAVISADVDPAAVALGLARDVALFDQRGCLSIAAVYVEGDVADARELGARLAEALGDLARQWPPGPLDWRELSAVQQLRLAAEMRGIPRFLPGSSVASGTVLVDPEPAFHPSPGLRTVRVHPLPDLGALPAILAPWKGRLQGTALAGNGAWRLAPSLAELGISRTAAPGDLQSPDASWQNGGIDPLAALA